MNRPNGHIPNALGTAFFRLGDQTRYVGHDHGAGHYGGEVLSQEGGPFMMQAAVAVITVLEPGVALPYRYDSAEIGAWRLLGCMGAETGRRRLLPRDRRAGSGAGGANHGSKAFPSAW